MRQDCECCGEYAECEPTDNYGTICNDCFLEKFVEEYGDKTTQKVERKEDQEGET